MRKFGILLTIVVAIGILCWWFGPRKRHLDKWLIKAAYNIETRRVAILLRLGASPTALYGDSGPEHFPKRAGGWPMAADRWTALIALANSDNPGNRIPIAKLLLDNGADINAEDGYGSTALCACCYYNRESLALYLLERGANPNTRTGIYIDGAADINPVHRATQNPTILRALITAGVDVNVVDGSGRSPLDWAVDEIDTQAEQILIQAGARRNADNK